MGEVTVILLGVLCTKKRWLLPQPIWKWGEKKRLATTAVYYVTRGGRYRAKSLLWTTPDCLRSEGDAVRITMVTRPRPNSGGGRQHRQIPVYPWLVVVDDDEFLRVVIRDFTFL